MSGSLEGSSPLFRFYHGRSMRHTFRDGDCVYFEKVALSTLSKGDVIVFVGKNSEEEDVIHRIVNIDSASFVTRGDNNLPEEVERVPFASVLGKAVSSERSGRKRKVAGGFAGTLRATLLSKRGFFRLSVKWCYSCLQKSNIVRLFWKPKIETIRISTDPPSIVRLLHKGETIGKLCTESNIFVLQKPYDLVVKYKDLPVSHKY